MWQHLSFSIEAVTWSTELETDPSESMYVRMKPLDLQNPPTQLSVGCHVLLRAISKRPVKVKACENTDSVSNVGRGRVMEHAVESWDYCFWFMGLRTEGKGLEDTELVMTAEVILYSQINGTGFPSEVWASSSWSWMPAVFPSGWQKKKVFLLMSVAWKNAKTGILKVGEACPI